MTGCRARTHAHVDAAPPPVDASLDANDASLDADADAADARPQLPRGGREIFPAHRLVGFCGTPGAKALGRLLGNLGARAKEIETFGEQYQTDRAALPVFELIAVVTTGLPGLDGKNRRRVPDNVVDDYLQAARSARALLLLNIQPGHSDFLTEVKHFESYLQRARRRPRARSRVGDESEDERRARQDVRLHDRPTTLNEVAEYLSTIVARERLAREGPRLSPSESVGVQERHGGQAHDGVVIIKSVDGLGPGGTKIKTYDAMVKAMPTCVHPGFKFFFDEDTAGGHRLMKPDEVSALTPEPEYVMYE